KEIIKAKLHLDKHLFFQEINSRGSHLDFHSRGRLPCGRDSHLRGRCIGLQV
ncbi:hypothetical protein GYH30_009177, partial [Glycine max]